MSDDLPEGFTLDEGAPPEGFALDKPVEPTAGAIGADVAKSAGVGLGKGIINTAGMFGDARELTAKAVNWGSKKLGYEIPAEAASRAMKAVPLLPMWSGPTSKELRSGVEGVTGEFYKPQTKPGHYAENVAEMAPAAIAGPGGVARRVAMQTVLPGVASEAAGQAVQGTKYARYEPAVRIGASLMAPMGVAGARRVFTPLPNAPGRQAMVDTLGGEGVNAATAGQRTGNKTLQYAESTLGDFPGAGAQAERAQTQAQQQFTQAALRRIGMDGVPPTRQHLDQAVQNIQDQFTHLSARNNLRYDPQLGRDIGAAVNRYDRKLPQQQREVFANYVADIAQQPGGMNGQMYQVTRSDLSRQANSVRNSDPTFSQALRDLRDALDNGMRRSISPADQVAWDTARQRWGNWRTIENAAKKTDAAGNVLITPTDLQNAASVRNRGQFARGQGDYAGLAQAGAPVLKTLPQSGTNPRNVVATVASGIGGAIGAALGGPGGAGAGIAGGVVAPALIGRALMSRPVQGYLGNQLWRGQPDTGQARIARALVGAEAAKEAAADLKKD